MFTETFGNFSYDNHCYFGIGIQPTDLQYVLVKHKPLILASLALNRLTNLFPFLKNLSDSVYVSAVKSPASARQTISHESEYPPLSKEAFLKLLHCPMTGQPLIYDVLKQELVSESAGIAYPIFEDVPVLLPEKARRISTRKS